MMPNARAPLIGNLSVSSSQNLGEPATSNHELHSGLSLQPLPEFAASSHEQVSSSSVEQFPRVASSSHEHGNAASGITVEEVQSEEPFHRSQEQGTSALSEKSLGAAATEEVQREEEASSVDIQNQTQRPGLAKRSSTCSIGEGQVPEEASILFDICKVYTGAIETTGDKQLGKYVDFATMLENIKKYDYFKGFLGLADKCIEDSEQHLSKVLSDLGYSHVSKLRETDFVTVVNSCREHANNNDIPEPKEDVVARTLMIFNAMDEDSSGKVTENEFGHFLNKKKCVSRALGFSSDPKKQRAQFHTLCGDDNVCEESEFYDFVANHAQGLTEADKEALQALQTKAKETEDARLTPLSPRRKSSSQSGISVGKLMVA